MMLPTVFFYFLFLSKCYLNKETSKHEIIRRNFAYYNTITYNEFNRCINEKNLAYSKLFENLG